MPPRFLVPPDGHHFQTPLNPAAPKWLYRALANAAWLALVLGISSCQTANFYVQAVQGSLEVQSHRHPVITVIADPVTPEKLKTKLTLAENLCAFAGQELKLPAAGQYQDYADLKRPYVVWNVFAAPEFSLEEKTWWYPILGNLAYRGFFQEAGANACAAELRAQGDDVFVGGIEVFSSLGWFHDPLLNTFIHHSEPILAENLFHELGHQRLFIPGDTDFNEAYATTVGQNGARLWLRHTGNADLLRRYEQHLQRLTQVVKLFQDTREKLALLYGDVHTPSGRIKASGKPPALPIAEMREKKKAILDEMHQSYGHLAITWGVDQPKTRTAEDEINNARLNSMATYYDLVPAFERILADQKGDWDAFYHKVQDLGRLPKEERRKVLEGLLPHQLPPTPLKGGGSLALGKASIPEMQTGVDPTARVATLP